MLLQMVECFAIPAESHFNLDKFCCFLRKDTPETGNSAILSLSTSPQKSDGGRVFRIEEFNSALADNSDVRFHHL